MLPSFKNELTKDSRILGVTGTASAMPFVNWRIEVFQWQGKDPDTKLSISFNAVDYDFIETLQMNIVDGKSFANKSFSESEFSLLVNKMMAELMEMGSVAGTPLARGDRYTKSSRCFNSEYSAVYIQRVIDSCSNGRYTCLACGALYHEHMAAKLRVQNKYQMVDLPAGRRAGTLHCCPDGERSIDKSRCGQPSGELET